ncbi:hypothetical protein C8A01DRAFT_35869 [Parachaetomium inaequale]|uniref:DUF7136 domain-containing protein n=1 Tax=Parachaetomium inaequale TaxID=2588326 RepID=A0AAN6PFK7_9PEZI|nr:hypothetical protein C8A01DRAFT_35869 [Parachaetomium inaequale]
MRHPFWAAAALALAVSAQQTPTTAQHVEIDIVFPRNETYRDTDVFPIVMAVQNISTIRETKGDYQIFWDIMPYSDGLIPGGILYDSGTLQILTNNTITGSTFLVAATNATKWLRENRSTGRFDRFMLQWYFEDSDREERCGGPRNGNAGRGGLMFNIQTAYAEDLYGLEGMLLDVDDIPECPQFAALVESGQNATNPECPTQKQLEGVQGNPCAVKVDQAAITSILSQASSLLAPTSTATSSTSTSSAGVGPARTVQTALAAACVLCGLAL